MDAFLNDIRYAIRNLIKRPVSPLSPSSHSVSVSAQTARCLVPSTRC